MIWRGCVVGDVVGGGEPLAMGGGRGGGWDRAAASGRKPASGCWALALPIFIFRGKRGYPSPLSINRDFFEEAGEHHNFWKPELAALKTSIEVVISAISLAIPLIYAHTCTCLSCATSTARSG